jgi:hypothetical protein
MSNVIGFLEKMGQDASLRHATYNEMELALTSAQIEPEMQEAIIAGDKSQLELLLGARINIVCSVFPGKEDDDEEDEESPSKDDDEITLSHVAVRRIA